MITPATHTRDATFPAVPPFLKWVGGKRWLAEKHSYLFPRSFETYIEPFLGSGAVFFHLLPTKSLLADLNQALVSTYQFMRDEHEKLHEMLKVHQRLHNQDHYYATRALNFDSSVESAARFIYLNRTCFNGIYRVNRRGEFNVPMGSKSTVILTNDNFQLAASALRNSRIVYADFELTISKSGKGDFLFVDPPYTVKHNCNGFKKYNESIFSWKDQERLAQSLKEAAARGAYILITNANHECIRKLYSDPIWSFSAVSRASVIASKSNFRGSYEEAIIRNY